MCGCERQNKQKCDKNVAGARFWREGVCWSLRKIKNVCKDYPKRRKLSCGAEILHYTFHSVTDALKLKTS